MNAQNWSARRAVSPLVLMALVLASMASPAPKVHAASTRTISVDDVPDSFPVLGCSLREAIDIANAGLTGMHFGCTVNQSGAGAPITYHIYLPKGGYTYTLTGADGEDGNASGDLDITVNVTISGWGASTTVIDGGGIDRVFDICPGGGCDNSVTIADVTIRNGDTTESGGGIHNSGTLTVTSGSTVAANMATNGGGVFSHEDSVDATRVTGSCIVGNSDTAFFNDETAGQTATGNWWGGPADRRGSVRVAATR